MASEARIFSRITFASNCIPLATYLGLLAFATYSYFSYGSWPQYNQPDPSNLGLAFIQTPIAIGIFASAPLLPINLILTITLLCLDDRFVRGLRRYLPHTLVFVFSVACWSVEFSRDGRLLNWFFD